MNNTGLQLHMLVMGIDLAEQLLRLCPVTDSKRLHRTEMAVIRWCKDKPVIIEMVFTAHSALLPGSDFRRQ